MKNKYIITLSDAKGYYYPILRYVIASNEEEAIDKAEKILVKDISVGYQDAEFQIDDAVVSNDILELK